MSDSDVIDAEVGEFTPPESPRVKAPISFVELTREEVDAYNQTVTASEKLLPGQKVVVRS